jgi:hypothetical protein
MVATSTQEYAIMANDSDEALEERLERIQRRAENFRELLKDGEEITIAFFDGEVKVEESFRTQFERKHPKLLGRMLSLEAQLEPGWLAYFFAMIAVVVILFGLQLGWWETWLGPKACELLNNWWFYIVLSVAAFYLVSLGLGQWRKRVYQRHRTELHRLISAEQLDCDVLLVMLRDFNDLHAIVQELKLDAGPFDIAKR